MTQGDGSEKKGAKTSKDTTVVVLVPQVEDLPSARNVILRGTIVIRTHDVHKNLYITVFCPNKPGPDYYVPP